MLRRRTLQRGPNPYSAARWHKGYAYDAIRHTVLTASQLPPEKIEMIAAALKVITNGPQALTLPDGNPGWSTTRIDHLGHAYVVAYCGVEVALFYKRQLTEIIPEPGEKIPEGVLQDPLEAWQRLDLMGRSAEKSNYVLTQSQRRLDEVNEAMRKRCELSDALTDDLESKLATARHHEARLEAEKADLEKQLRTARASIKAMFPTPKQKTSLKKPGKRGKQHSKSPAKHIKRRRFGKYGKRKDL